MRITVGIDIAKDIHWVTAMDDQANIRLDKAVENHPTALASVIAELQALDAELVVGMDVIGGIAGLVCAMLDSAGIAQVHIPGVAVNRARQGTVGGEHKSDPRDARVIADQVRIRNDLRPIEVAGSIETDIRLLVRRRHDLTEEQTRRMGRLHDLLVSIFPGLERSLDLTTKGPLWLLTRYVTPAELRTCGRKRLLRHMNALPHCRNAAALASIAIAQAEEQNIAAAGEQTVARLIRELAAEALAAKEKLAALDAELEALLALHPEATLIRSLPGMGVTLTAELIAEAGNLSRFRSADALAAAAGIAPVLRQSGKMRFLRRPSRGNKGLKRVFYQAAFCSLSQPDSRAFYDRKRKEGKRHHQAVLALARRRVNVLWAVVRNKTPFQENFKQIA